MKDQRNTIVRYLYRDASNYKKQNACIIHGEMSPSQWERILATLDEDAYFIPSAVGMPETRFENYDPQEDHPFFELDQDFELTSQPATVQKTTEELARAFERCAGKWEELGVQAEE